MSCTWAQHSASETDTSFDLIIPQSRCAPRLPFLLTVYFKQDKGYHEGHKHHNKYF